MPQSGPIREVGVTVHLGTGIEEHKHQLLGTKINFYSGFCQRVMRILRIKTNDFQRKQPASYRSFCFCGRLDIGLIAPMITLEYSVAGYVIL